MIKFILRILFIGFMSTLIVISTLFFLDIRDAYNRIQGKSTVINSPYGKIEFSQRGTGPHVLVIHGSGGGFDQGELIADSVLGNQFHCIIPSRFGYLKSTFNDGATFDQQADAYLYLLDHLNINSVAVVAISHGAPSALLLALLYPERVSSLTLLSAGVASSSTDDQTQANKQGNALVTIFKYDPLYWLISKFFKKSFMELMGANETVIASLTPQQIQLVEHLIDYMNPVSPRSDGVLFDNKAEMPNDRIVDIITPTLIIHAVDDTLQIFYNAEFALANIPNAEMLKFNKGGHLLTFIELKTIREAIQNHILDNLTD